MMEGCSDCTTKITPRRQDHGITAGYKTLIRILGSELGRIIISTGNTASIEQYCPYRAIMFAMRNILSAKEQYCLYEAILSILSSTVCTDEFCLH